jgi:glucosamine-6-phosphate deaminase
MPELFPEYLSVPADRLGYGQPVSVTVVADAAALAAAMARDMAAVIRAAAAEGRQPTLIIPVGPVDQFPVLAELVNRERLSLRETLLINMDEYLTDDDAWLPREHPLSFRGFMDRMFYDRLDAELAPSEELRLFPDPGDLGAVERWIVARGGVDACFGGIGINGHMAFNEPPEPGAAIRREAFADLPTRVLSLARETRTINANTVGGSLDVVPRRCVTVGMREILAARRLRFYCNRPWQSAVVRRVLHGEISPACPATYLRLHADAAITLTQQVADPPVIALR